MQLKSVRVKSIRRLGTGEVHDISVPGADHYITRDGTIHHNTGLRYFCDTMLRLSKSKPKDSKLDTDDMDTTGGQSILITADKNRFAVPKKSRIELSFTEGANPYRNLEFFCTPENYESIGITNHKIVEEVDKETGEVSEKFKNSSMWTVKHLGKMMYRSKMFSPEVFTPEVLEAIDEVTKKYYSYGESAITKFEELNEDLDKDMESKDKPEVEGDDTHEVFK